MKESTTKKNSKTTKKKDSIIKRNRNQFIQMLQESILDSSLIHVAIVNKNNEYEVREFGQ